MTNAKTALSLLCSDVVLDVIRMDAILGLLSQNGGQN